MADWPGLFNAGDERAAIAGVLGGLVRWMSLREHWKDGLISIAVGAICAVYVTPLVVPWLSPGASDPSVQIVSLASFVTGIGGIGVVGFIVDLWRTWRKRSGGTP